MRDKKEKYKKWEKGDIIKTEYQQIAQFYKNRVRKDKAQFQFSKRRKRESRKL